MKSKTSLRLLWVSLCATTPNTMDPCLTKWCIWLSLERNALVQYTCKANGHELSLRLTSIILLATSNAELQELVDRLDRVSRKYSLLINVDKTKVMASNGIACRILIQNEQLEQVDTFPYLESLITEYGECTTEFWTTAENTVKSQRACQFQHRYD